MERETFVTICELLFCTVLMVASVYDVKRQKVSRIILAVGILITLIMNTGLECFFKNSSADGILINSAEGVLVGGMPLFIAYLYSKFISKKDSVGICDIIIFAISGGFLGFRLILNFYFVLVLVSFVCISVMLLFRIKVRKDKINVVPFVTTAVIVTIFIDKFWVM